MVPELVCPLSPAYKLLLGPNSILPKEIPVFVIAVKAPVAKSIVPKIEGEPPPPPLTPYMVPVVLS